MTFLHLAKLVYLIVVPEWATHHWHTLLRERASHRFIFPVGDEVISSPANYWPLCAYTVDTRYTKRATNLITVYLPQGDHKTRVFFPPRQLLPLQDSTFISARPRPHLNAQWFLKWGTDLPPKLLSDVVTGIKVGFPTQYRGGGRRLRKRLRVPYG